jgi:hypothetical protein
MQHNDASVRLPHELRRSDAAVFSLADKIGGK